jgi:hypothetical protein
LCLATLGWRGFSIEVLIRTIRSAPSSGFGGKHGLKKPKKVLIVRVLFDGKYYEQSYSVTLIDHAVSIVANFITNTVKARIVNVITRVSGITAKSGSPIVKKDDVVAKYSDSVKINAKLK